ncbi:MAG: ArsA family ATPase [Bdellovibrionales bacterium]|nr:ArsA family ATPase [Bdellovibrionales bacterium]
MIDLLKRHRVLICAGTGGVGKTSLSASLGVLAAQSGLRTLVLTIDPAHRLAQALGLEKQAGVDVPVPAVPGLHACMIDPRSEFDEFVLGSVDNTIAKGLFNNRLYQQLVSNLNGSQEFTSLVRLLKSVRDPNYDLVILDTPPTQNAVDFLKAPERLYALFQDTVIGWFAHPEKEESFIKRTLHRGTRLVTTALEAVTGSKFIAELKDFFTHISHLRGRISEISWQVGDLLHAESTGFILVTGFDETKLKEALEFQADLQGENLHLRAVIVNRWFPEWSEGSHQWSAEWSHSADFKELKEFYERFSEFFRQRQEAYDRFVHHLGQTGADPSPVLKLPDFKNTVQGIEDLTRVATTINEKWRSLP